VIARGGNAFLASAQAPASAAVTPDPDAVLAARTRAHRFAVTPVPLAALKRWQLTDASLTHETGRFFSIDGVAVETSFGTTPRWSQPIIQQPEIGILGFLAQQIGGVMHLLAQAKMEPGNRTMVQFSPTVQATPSNYRRVHGGRSTPYLEYFLEGARGTVLVDQLQSEQGTRYYRKRNRNMIVQVPDDERVPLGDDFVWLTLAQLHVLLAAGDRVNMNGRTVLSCVPYDGNVAEIATADPFRRAVLESRIDPRADDDALQGALTWLTDRRAALDLDTRRIRLADLEHCICDEQSIRHVTGKFFQIIGVEVAAESREVGAWMQPMMEPTREGVIAFLCQRRAGVLEVLVQARAEAGFIDRVELGPTILFSPGNYDRPEDLPPFADHLKGPASWVKMRAPQSEDGGRFYHDETLHQLIEVPEDETVTLPANYRWMSLRLLGRLMRRGYHVAIEARSLLACLG